LEAKNGCWVFASSGRFVFFTFVFRFFCRTVSRCLPALFLSSVAKDLFRVLIALVGSVFFQIRFVFFFHVLSVTPLDLFGDLGFAVFFSDQAKVSQPVWRGPRGQARRMKRETSKEL